MQKQAIVIVGGGAAGMFAALIAAENWKLPIVLLEASDRLGKKLAATGNGRCNLTNVNLTTNNYYGRDRNFAGFALKNFTPTDTMEYFAELGAISRIEDGRVYPYSSQASSVVDILRFALERKGVEICTECTVKSIKKLSGGSFLLETSQGEMPASRLIITGGGMVSPAFSGNKNTYSLLTQLGHKLTPIFPALVQLKTDLTYVKALKGVKVNATAHLISSTQLPNIAGKTEAKGEVLFTDYGISGIAVMELSRAAIFTMEQEGKEETLTLDFMPEFTKEQIKNMLLFRIKTAPNLPLAELFTGTLNKRLGQTVCKYAGLPPFGLKSGDLSLEQVEALATAVKDFRLAVTGHNGLANAQVTAGGIDTREFDPQTMESTLVPGLFAAGEILDIDGDCGGYNLQWAWSSAYLAGKNVGKGL